MKVCRENVASMMILTCHVVAMMWPSPAVSSYDKIGIWFDAGGQWSRCAQLLPYQQAEAYLIIQDASARSGVSGWECTIAMTSNIVVTQWDIMNGFNLFVPPQFEVGLGEYNCLPQEAMRTLMRMSVYIADDQPGRFLVHAGPRDSMGTGMPVYAAGDDASDLRSLQWISGSENEPVAAINDSTCVWPTAVHGDEEVVSMACFPNPANPVVSICYSLIKDAEVVLAIYDCRGRRVFRRESGIRAQGRNVEQWDGRDNDGRPVASGAYDVVLEAGRMRMKSAVVLIR